MVRTHTIAVTLALAGALLLSACTNGGIAVPGGGGSASTTIDINLTLHAPTQTQAGSSGGYAPAVTTVAVGSTIRFTNSDGFAHTATMIPGSQTFPSASPFSVSAQTQNGSNISQSWSSGTLPAGASSQTILVDKAGTYLFGCFFHYSAPMRGVIIAQ